jgi:hypothetical protein
MATRHDQEVADMMELLGWSSAALDIDPDLVHPDTRATLAALRQARADADRASALVTSTAQSLGSGCKR